MSLVTRVSSHLPHAAILLALIPITVVPPAAVPVARAQNARTVTVLVGAGQDQLQALAYFPQSVRIHQGDTVLWTRNGDEIHTVSFTHGTDPGPNGVWAPLEGPGARIPSFSIAGAGENGVPAVNPQVAWPTRLRGAPVEQYTGAFVSSGILDDAPIASGMPVNDSFQLSFPNAGTFSYVCLVHGDRMQGTIEVVPVATSVPDQAAIDTQAQTEISALTRVLQAANAVGDAPARQDPAPNGTSTWYVKAGGQDIGSNDQRAQVLDFQPKSLVISSGDTVVWSSRYFHTVSFVPREPAPEFLEDELPIGGNLPVITFEDEAYKPAKPSAVYDPTQYFNSGLLGQFTTYGDSWSLTFVQPGTFSYQCLIHDDNGMKGTIVVQAAGASSAPSTDAAPLQTK